ncbi:MAG: DNA topoisomerase (ATP-hydrolyzing) [Thermosynechococcus sp.]|uniref:DNA gyrase/topoisomerase IV subunit A n=1 Tax=Thermosynechococcus sp. TaxID=2814275 RepID=UPI00220968F5|nr:DNA topoisomerase (ATP-hydrolyzing) [Thermosynechococcus sp.]BCX13294.1 MAG: DNA topoisomerase (ATP-hydrolyzing) [Thermosynechococcus sp.]
MPKQLDLLTPGQVIPTAVHSEMQRSYLEYAMSVIVGRALPDVRDGLKPVHRRILYAMYELGLTPDRPFRKCARVVGDVLGKYHPHGDQAVYEALVRLVQPFSSRYPLLAGHGNFGSIDDDPPAAMRYTETRLAAIAHRTLLENISNAIVDFAPNFDSSQAEPLVLPAQLPILLLNGSTGIAVGMATNIPPHNLGEVVDALIALIDRPHLSLEELLTHLPGPDFPTGGVIVDGGGLRRAYRTGRGTITLRGVATLEDIAPGRGRHRRQGIVVTELPYQVNKAAWIEKVADLVNQGRLEGIADLRDESDREGLRVVIELKRDAPAAQLLEQLYHLTALQVTYGINLMALVDNQPRQLSLKEILGEFLQFREETLLRQYRHDLETAQARQQVVTGLLIGLNAVEQVIEIVRSAADGSAAQRELMTRLGLSDRQASALIAMPLRRLTQQERQELEREQAELQGRIAQLQTLIHQRPERLKALKKELRQLKKEFGDPRRTQILRETPAPEEVPAGGGDALWIEIRDRGYGRCLPQPRRRSLPLQTWLPWSEPLPLGFSVQASDRLWVFTESGRVYPLPVERLPLTSRREGDRGHPLLTLLPESAQGESLLTVLPSQVTADKLILLTRQGRLKVIPISDLQDLSGRGLQLTKLKAGDALGWVLPADRGHLVLATSRGRVFHFFIPDIPALGRLNQGQAAVRLSVPETLVGAIALSEPENVILVTASGLGKQVPLPLIEVVPLGHLGQLAMPLPQRSDRLAGIGRGGSPLALVTTQERAWITNGEEIPLLNKEAMGVAIAPLDPGEQVQAVVALA